MYGIPDDARSSVKQAWRRPVDRRIRPGGTTRAQITHASNSCYTRGWKSNNFYPSCKYNTHSPRTRPIDSTNLINQKCFVRRVLRKKINILLFYYAAHPASCIREPRFPSNCVPKKKKTGVRACALVFTQNSGRNECVTRDRSSSKKSSRVTLISKRVSVQKNVLRVGDVFFFFFFTYYYYYYIQSDFQTGF